MLSFANARVRSKRHKLTCANSCQGRNMTSRGPLFLEGLFSVVPTPIAIEQRTFCRVKCIELPQCPEAERF